MTRYYPSKPRKRRSESYDDEFGYTLIVSMMCALPALLGAGFYAMLNDIQPGVGIPMMFLYFAIGTVASFLYQRFKHLGSVIKVNRAYKKDMKEYNSRVAEINLAGDRADSEVFINELRKGK